VRVTECYQAQQYLSAPTMNRQERSGLQRKEERKFGGRGGMRRLWLVRSNQLHGASPSQESNPLSASQIPVPDNTQHSQETDIHAHGGFRTRSPNNKRPLTHALDRPATEIGYVSNNMFKENVEKKCQ